MIKQSINKPNPSNENMQTNNRQKGKTETVERNETQQSVINDHDMMIQQKCVPNGKKDDDKQQNGETVLLSRVFETPTRRKKIMSEKGGEKWIELD